MRSFRSLFRLAMATAALALAGCEQSPDAPHYDQDDATTGSLLHQQYQAGSAGNNSSSYTHPFISGGGK